VSGIHRQDQRWLYLREHSGSDLFIYLFLRS
jgi:hypothetical protein